MQPPLELGVELLEMFSTECVGEKPSVGVFEMVCIELRDLHDLVWSFPWRCGLVLGLGGKLIPPKYPFAEMELSSPNPAVVVARCR